MSEPSLCEQILAVCKKVRLAGQYVEIDFMLPSVLYYRDGDTAFHFQEDHAEQLITVYRPTAEQTGLPLRDVLLWAAQEWDLEGTSLIIGKA